MTTREEIENKVRADLRRAQAVAELLATPPPPELAERFTESERRYLRALDTYMQRKAEYKSVQDEVRDFAAPFLAVGVSRATISAVLGITVPPSRVEHNSDDNEPPVHDELLQS